MTAEVEVMLDGQPVRLRCTLRAAKDINRAFGSYTGAFRKVMEYDLDAFIGIVASGLGKSGKDVEDAVFRTGMPDLVRPLTDYLSMLSTGGRPPAPVDDEANRKPGEQ